MFIRPKESRLSTSPEDQAELIRLFRFIGHAIQDNLGIKPDSDQTEQIKEGTGSQIVDPEQQLDHVQSDEQADTPQP